jgi:lambda repressor-like predicted transcriptional regulator
MGRNLRAIREARSRRAERIKLRLLDKGYRLVDVDRAFGLTEGSARNGLRQPHQPAEMAIASILGVAPSSLWPERYDSRGRWKRPQPRSNYEETPKRTRPIVAGRQPGVVSHGASQPANQLEAAE